MSHTWSIWDVCGLEKSAFKKKTEEHAALKPANKLPVPFQAHLQGLWAYVQLWRRDLSFTKQKAILGEPIIKDESTQSSGIVKFLVHKAHKLV